MRPQFVEDCSSCASGEIMPGSFRFEILSPEEVAGQYPAYRDLDLWLYRYTNPAESWELCIATFGAPGSGALSLGGFRILPEERCMLPGFSVAREALDLACGMEKKVHWSRAARVGGPRGRAELDRIVGGKCVLRPAAGSRVGEPDDFNLLQFALDCFSDFEARSGVFLTTGQDLGHGLMSDKRTGSIDYLNSKFSGCISSNTSLPTAWGNFFVIEGVLKALSQDFSGTKFGIYGCGNIGHNVLAQLQEHGGAVVALDSSARALEELAKTGIPFFELSQRADFFMQKDLEVVVINANGSTLDSATVELLASNKSVRVICGCENLMLVNPADQKVLQKAKKIFCPPEYCGMMGYLTAVEEYLTRQAGEDWDLNVMWESSQLLSSHAFEIAQSVTKSDFSHNFQELLG